MKTIVVRYRVKPDAGEANTELVRAVFAELADTDPGGVRYATFRLEDGQTFVHVAQVEGPANPLPETTAFKQFQAELADRCEEPPVAMEADVVGSYRLLADQG